jgi:G2/mitotic-specific cyclin-B, other
LVSQFRRHFQREEITFLTILTGLFVLQQNAGIAPAAEFRPAPRLPRKAPAKPPPSPPERVVVVSSDSELDESSASSVRKVSRKKMINTLTSVLSARSKVRHLFKELLELVIAFTTFYGSKTCASGLILASECQAAGGITDKAQLLIEDIDKSDGGKEFAAVDYIEDVYKFYKIAEVTANISAL